MPEPSYVPKASTARGNRIGGRNSFQEAKRRQTREAILAGAGLIFSRTPYVLATIDDLIRAAGISRATFYMHFDSKLALALAIYDGIAADWLELFDELGGIAGNRTDELTDWLHRLAGLYVSHGYVTSLVVQLSTFEPSFRLRLRQDGDALIDRLGRAGIGGFAKAIGEGDAARRRRAQAHLILKRIDQICSDLSAGEIPDGIEEVHYVWLGAEELGAFIEA